MALIPVADALARILGTAAPVDPEEVALEQAAGRVLAADHAAQRTQPPFDTSAMDGYAVRAADLAGAPVELALVGRSVAGRRFDGTVGHGEAVRIFTGAPLPEGADTILIQENARAEGHRVVALQEEAPGRFVRRQGLDFVEGDILLRSGTRIGARHVALAAAMNHSRLCVRRRPRVAILAAGDELVLPGTDPGPDQIVASNGYGVSAMVARLGGEALDLGLVPDRADAIQRATEAARDARADVLVTLGGASVGEHDLVHAGLAAAGMETAFWKVAMRPGKPLLYGRLGPMRVLGLPGNPVSALVCAQVFLRPLLGALLGLAEGAQAEREAVLGRDLPANDERQDYLRAGLSWRPDGRLLATPFAAQDSSMLAVLARSQALLVRPPHAPAATSGDRCRIIPLDD